MKTRPEGKGLVAKFAAQVQTLNRKPRALTHPDRRSPATEAELHNLELQRMKSLENRVVQTEAALNAVGEIARAKSSRPAQAKPAAQSAWRKSGDDIDIGAIAQKLGLDLGRLNLAQRNRLKEVPFLFLSNELARNRVLTGNALRAL